MEPEEVKPRVIKAQNVTGELMYRFGSDEPIKIADVVDNNNATISVSSKAGDSLVFEGSNGQVFTLFIS